MASYDRDTPRPSRTTYLLPLLLLLALGAVLLWRFWPASPRDGLDPNAPPRAVTPRGDLADDEKTTIEIFNNTSPSAVHITTLVLRHDVLNMDVFQIPKGTGSGFVWDADGHIVTNYHVIQGADAARVTLADQSNWKARLVGGYPDKDLAVLVIDAPKERCALFRSGRRTI